MPLAERIIPAEQPQVNEAIFGSKLHGCERFGQSSSPFESFSQ